MCNGGQAKQLTSLESWILGEGRPAMGISLSAVYFFSFEACTCCFLWLGFVSCCMLFCASFLCFFLLLLSCSARARFFRWWDGLADLLQSGLLLRTAGSVSLPECRHVGAQNL
jgi:hypothetical protein